MARAYSGVFRSGNAGHALWAAEWSSFEAKWKELSGKGMRLASISASVDGGRTQFTGVYEAGSGGHALWVSGWASFEAKWKELSAQGLRLVSIAGWVEGTTPRFAGVFRAGSGGYALWVSGWASFEAKWKELSAQGLRLISLATYVEGGVARFAGVFRAGSGGHALWVAPWTSFEAKWKELSGQGLRLVSIDSFVDGGVRKWAGAYLPGNGGHALWAGVDWESFVARWHEYTANGLRLVDTSGHVHPCSSGCLNQVVMPEGSYNYAVTGHDQVYRWPVDLDGGRRYARLPALHGIASFLTLPFTDTGVERRGIWRYGNGGWHHAGDYSRDDVATFGVVACAAGRVVHVGWDTWSGNTVIVSHDVGGVADAYRTDLHAPARRRHPRRQRGLERDDPDAVGDNLTEYRTHLNDTGCPQTGKRTLDAGPLGHRAPRRSRSRSASRSRAASSWPGPATPDRAASAGRAGPTPTCTSSGAGATPTDGRWYLFDPYGVYAEPGCYAAGVTEATTGAVRALPGGVARRPSAVPVRRSYRADRRRRRRRGPRGRPARCRRGRRTTSASGGRPGRTGASTTRCRPSPRG